jgi:hypothetical protein
MEQNKTKKKEYRLKQGEECPQFDTTRKKNRYCDTGLNCIKKKCEPKADVGKNVGKNVGEEWIDDLLSFRPLDLSKKSPTISSPIQPIVKDAFPRCPDGSRRNNKTKECEKVEDRNKRNLEDNLKKQRKTRKLVIRENNIVEQHGKPRSNEENPVVALVIPKKAIASKKRKIQIREKEVTSSPEAEPIPTPHPEKEVDDELPIPTPHPEKEVNDELPTLVQIRDEPAHAFEDEDEVEAEDQGDELEIEAEIEAEEVKDGIDSVEKAYEQKRNTNEFLLEKERIEYLQQDERSEYDFLYPHLNDPNFNIKIAKKKEFNDTKYDGNIKNIEQQADLLCKSDFELMPHQLFVKNFLSFQTPYNALLLYHGLGTGKTCSAIGVAEEMRAYMKQIGQAKDKVVQGQGQGEGRKYSEYDGTILIVAKPNVQQNFQLQLFDERKLKNKDNLWTLNTCIGNSLLKEINPTNIPGLTKERIISQVNGIIKNYYSFIGYIGLANYIKYKIHVDENAAATPEERKRIRIKKIKTYFSNRLIIIDEVHNIPTSSDNEKVKTASLLLEVAHYADNIRLLLLSATPMFNSYKEIIWLTNLMNSVDKRGVIRESDVFDKNGEFKKVGKHGEGGRELLQRKLTGYISYVRGENPYTFPYRIYPDIFSPNNTVKVAVPEYPARQMNSRSIDSPLRYVPVYITECGEYQKGVYKALLRNMMDRDTAVTMATGQVKEMPTFENMDGFGYTILKEPLEALNIVYPTIHLDTEGFTEDTIPDRIGKRGLSNTFDYATTTSPNPLRYNFAYKPEILETYGRFLSPPEIGKYSHKIASICETIRSSVGIVMVYSQYIDGGLVPMALALEEMGFARYGFASHTRSLFKEPPTKEVIGRYVMITGDRNFSPNNLADIKYITDPANKNGDNVKVVLISRAAAEGLDFKNIRQIHILEPWYNMNRNEQIIGRGVRNLSHCGLPFKQRNVEIYLHATKPIDDEEPADMYVYRYAETKSIQIGKVTRLLKEVAVDCILHIGQTNFTIDALLPENTGVTLELSSESGKEVDYEIGDRPFTDVCDYMENCAFTCSPNARISPSDVVMDTYNEEFVKTNYAAILKRIRQLYREKHAYTSKQILDAMSVVKPYPEEQVYFTLSQLVDNKNEYIVDSLGRPGYLTNTGDIYAFLPVEITDTHSTMFERSIPVDVKREYIEMELPTEKVATGYGEVVEEKPELPKRDYNTVLLHIQKCLGFAARVEMKNEKGEEEFLWYKYAGKVTPTLVTAHHIPQETLLKYALWHCLDRLPLADRLLLISRLYVAGGKLILEIENLLKEYFDEKKLEYQGVVGMVLADGESWMIYKQVRSLSALPTVPNEGEGWVLTEPVERDNFIRNGLLRFVVRHSTLHSIVGFMNNFKGDVEFKMKDMTQIRNNRGSKCDNEIKSDVMKRMTLLLGEEMYTASNTENIEKAGLCVMLEMLCRYYNETRRDGKTWFMDVERALINKIATLKMK